MRRSLEAFAAVRPNKNKDSEMLGWENNAELQPRPGLGGIADLRIWRGTNPRRYLMKRAEERVEEQLHFSRWLAILIEHRIAMSMILVDRRRSDQPATGAVLNLTASMTVDW